MMQCPDCGELTHPRSSCIDYELDVWFFQTELGEAQDYGEWIFDNHCLLSEFLKANDLEIEELLYIMQNCRTEKGFMLGGGASPLYFVDPKRPTTH